MLGSKVGSTVIITKAGKSRFISCLMKTIIPSMTESFKIIRNTCNTLNTPLCLFGHHSISKVTSPPKQRAIQSSHRSTASQRSVAEIKQTRPRIGLPPDRSHRHVRIPLSGNRREPNPISCARAFFPGTFVAALAPRTASLAAAPANPRWGILLSPSAPLPVSTCDSDLVSCW